MQAHIQGSSGDVYRLQTPQSGGVTVCMLCLSTLYMKKFICLDKNTGAPQIGKYYWQLFRLDGNLKLTPRSIRLSDTCTVL